MRESELSREELRDGWKATLVLSIVVAIMLIIGMAEAWAEESTSIGIIQPDGSFDLEWKLTIFPEHELNLYYEHCKVWTAGCTNMAKKEIWLYGPQMNAIPWYGGETILRHEILHAQGLDHKQIKECCPNKIIDDYLDRYIPMDRSPKMLASIEHYKSQTFR